MSMQGCSKVNSMHYRLRFSLIPPKEDTYLGLRDLVTKCCSQSFTMLPNLVFTRWQMQDTERGPAKQVLKRRFNFSYLTSCSGTDTQGGLEFI